MAHGTGWWFLGMHLFWWLFWFALIATTFTTFTPVPRSQAKAGFRPLEILRCRYAAGQVTTEEYERRKGVLERDEPQGSPVAHAH